MGDTASADYERWLGAIPLGETWRSLPEGAARIDPGSLCDRLRLYRALLESAPVFLGAHGERHIFWGYAAQLHWQQQSGRLGECANEDRVAESSWWGAMNATLSLLPARAAQRAGLLAELEIAEQGDPVAPHAARFTRASERWTSFFEEVARVDTDASWEAARVSGWRAHVTSIAAGVQVFAPLWRHLPAPEAQFGRGWTRMVGFFGSAALRTDLEAIARYKTSLPPRMLRSGEGAGNLADFDDDTNDATRRIVALAELPAWKFALRRIMWNRSMRDPLLRAESLDILFGERGKDPEIQRRFRRALLPGPVLAGRQRG